MQRIVQHRLVTLATLLLGAASFVAAQTGSVRIQVVNFRGERIGAAAVSLLGANEKLLRTTVTDIHGEAVLPDLPAGANKFLITATHFHPAILTLRVEGFAETFRMAELQLGEPIIDEVPIEALNPADRAEWVPLIETQQSPIPAELPTPRSEAKPERKHWWIFW